MDKELIKKVTIYPRSGRVFACAMKVSDIKKFRLKANNVNKDNNLFDMSLLTAFDGGNEPNMWIRPSNIEMIMVEHISNIGVPPEKPIVGPGGQPVA